MNIFNRGLYILQKQQRYCFSNGASLFTWGKQPKSLGYEAKDENKKPKLISGFKNNVKQVDMGENHSALITTNGELFTWGNGESGALGHNNDKTYVEPRLVEFFVKNNLKVEQVALGQYHTVVRTNDGDVWTWGYGGKQQNFLMDLLFLQVGALGHGDNITRYSPTPVEMLRKLPPIKHISCGHRFVNAVNVNNQLYNWGKGDYGVFGDGNNNSLKQPLRNEYFDFLQNKQNLEIIELKSCNNYTISLMSDGQLYGWGSNENGQMGITTEIGVEIYETANFPTKVVNDNFQNKKIIDFAVGEDITVVLLDTNEVYWSGSKIFYKPERLRLPDGISKITHIGTCHRCVVVATDDGNIYFTQKYVLDTQQIPQSMQTGISQIQANKLFGLGKLIKIGGSYRNRYALYEQQDSDQENKQVS